MSHRDPNDRVRAPGRRAFLRRGALLGSAALLAPSACGDDAAPRSLGLRIERWRLRRLLRRLRGMPLTESVPAFFSYLELDPGGVKRFETAWLEDRRAPRSLADLERMFSVFLSSTDFFEHDADETRRIQFVQLRDPLKAPCFDPVRTYATKR